MSLLDTALRFADYEPQPFIAPVPVTGVVDVFSLQNGVPLCYTLRNQQTGWWEINPTGKRRAVLRRAAWGHEVGGYLEALPRFYAIACVPSGEKCWLVVPYNASDAAQRGWKNGEPRQVYLVNDNIEPFDVIVVRNLAGLMLYDAMDYRLGQHTRSELLRQSAANKLAAPNERDWNNAFRIFSEWLAKCEKEAALADIEKKTASITDRMRFMLEFMGAQLVASEKKGNGYVVTWLSPDGHTYNMGVREDGRISVAGICLNNTDAQNNLSSIVMVMETARKLNRPDLDHNEDDDDEDW